MRQPFSLYRRQNGVWYYTTYSKSGKRIYRSTGSTKKGEAYAIAMERFRTDTLIEAPEVKLARFKDFATDFWNYDTCPVVQDKIARGGSYTRRSASDNARLLETRILPFFGEVYFCDLNVAMVKRWMMGMSREISAKSINNIVLVLRQMLDVAVDNGLIASNPARAVKPLIQKKGGRGCFTREQVEAIVEACKDPMMRLIVRLAAKTGMRQGEIRALTVEQIKDRYILVDSSWSRVDGRKGTKAGYARVVPIEPQFRAELLEFAPCPTGLIFTQTGDTPVSPEWIEGRLQTLMHRVGIDWKGEKLCFHSLRHFANTEMLAGGIAPDIVRKIIGHTSETMTENYLHVSEETLDSVAFIQMGVV